MKRILKFIGIFLFWMIASVVLYFLILLLAIEANGGRPVYGGNYTILTVFIISLLIGLVHFRKNKKK